MPPSNTDQARRLRPVPLATSLSLQGRSMSALLVRFLITRYGRENIGFVWVILEPMILCSGVMVVWSLMKGPYDHGLKIIAIIFSGYMPLTLWRHLTNSAVFLMRASKTMVLHRNITYMDVLLSRFFLEFVGTSAAACVVYGALFLAGVLEPVHDLSLILAGWCLMAAYGVGFALIIAALSEMSEATEKFIGPFQYLMLPISGCFFMVEWLPARAQALIVNVPFVHAFEAFRAGFFGPSVLTHYSIEYGVTCALVMMALGVTMVRRVLDRVGA